MLIFILLVVIVSDLIELKMIRLLIFIEVILLLRYGLIEVSGFISHIKLSASQFIVLISMNI